MLDVKTVFSLLSSLPMGRSLAPSSSMVRQILHEVLSLFVLTVLGLSLAVILIVGVVYWSYVGLMMLGLIPLGAAAIVGVACSLALFVVYRAVIDAAGRLSHAPEKIFPATESPIAPVAEKVSSVTGAFLNGLLNGSSKKRR